MGLKDIWEMKFIGFGDGWILEIEIERGIKDIFKFREMDIFCLYILRDELLKENEVRGYDYICFLDIWVEMLCGCWIYRFGV